jgi:hypothetical protein
MPPSPKASPMSKRDRSAINVRLTDEENAYIRLQASRLDMEVSVVVRKCLALGIPQLLFNNFVRRVDLEDVISGKNSQ